jgi:S-adenosylmethionine/arginine decarboxylase-like enzyme
MRNINNKEAKYGMELVIDLHDCDVSKLTKKNLDIFFKRLCEISHMEAVGKPKYWKCDIELPHLKGYSGIQFIKTSDIIIHTLDITKDAYINFFSCKDFNIPEVLAFIVDHFGVGYYHYTYLKRGHHRNHQETEFEIRLINEDEARYDTWGDYYEENDKIIFQIVRSTKEIYTKLTLIHEMIECFLLQERQYPLEFVDIFDRAFENDHVRKELYFEPGDDPTCPYKKEHQLADDTLKAMCKQMGIDFKDYMNG